MRKLIAVAFAAVFVLVTAAPAFADAAVPLRGTIGAADFSQVTVGMLPTSGEPGLLVTVQLDTNLGPVTATEEYPFSTFVAHANGRLVRVQGLGTWDFGSGNVLHTQITGVISFGSGMVALDEDVIGGNGIYAGAAGNIHVSQFGPQQSAFPPFGGFIAGVIILN